jgi:hypothetical protein
MAVRYLTDVDIRYCVLLKCCHESDSRFNSIGIDLTNTIALQQKSCDASNDNGGIHMSAIRDEKKGLSLSLFTKQAQSEQREKKHKNKTTSLLTKQFRHGHIHYYHRNEKP